MSEENSDTSDYNYSEDNSDNISKNKLEFGGKNTKLITIGLCSRFYLYILGVGSFKLLSLLILGADNILDDGIGLFGFCPVIYEYNFIQSIIIYIGYIIFGFIFYYFKYIKKSKQKENSDDNEYVERKSDFNKGYIYNKPEDNFKNNMNIKVIFLFVIFSIHIETKKVLYIQGFQFFNFWTCEVIIMQFLMGKYFKIYFYRHHKVSIMFNAIFGSIILIITSFLPSSLSNENQGNSYQNIKEKFGSYFYCILLILLFVILSLAFCFTRVYSKVLMQIRFMSPYKLVFLFGISGLVISLLASVIGYYIDYPDNLINYFSSMKSVYDQGKKYNFFGEIFLVMPIYAFSNAMEFIFEILTIYYLNPFYILMSNTLYYAINEFILFMINLSNDGLVIIHFILTELAEIWISLGLMVYLEIIELNFWGLNDKLKKNIIKTGENEFKLLSGSKFKEEEEERNSEGNDDTINQKIEMNKLGLQIDT